MKRFFTAALTLTFAASVCAATSDSSAISLEPTALSVIGPDEHIAFSDDGDCCWVLLLGRWVCMPCH